MPKTYNNLYAETASFENLLQAYFDARKKKRYKPEILEFYDQYERRLMELHHDLENKTWESGTYRNFLSRTEVKRRIINAPTFRDRIVQMGIYRVVNPLFDQKYIFDSYACRIGRGTHDAADRTQDFLKRAARKFDRVYVLQGDISDYYGSVWKPYLMEKIARTIRDRDILNLLEKIYYGFNNEDRGIPIGAVTSQMGANINLDTLDHFVKECIGAKYYVRYMDDFVIICGSKEELWSMLEDIKWLVETTLHLKLNPKTRIYPASRGVDFVGYRIWKTHKLPRKRDIKAAKIRFKDLSHKFKHGKATLKDVKPRVDSFLGYVKHCNAHRTTISTLKWLKLTKGDQYNEDWLYQDNEC